MRINSRQGRCATPRGKLSRRWSRLPGCQRGLTCLRASSIGRTKRFLSGPENRMRWRPRAAAGRASTMPSDAASPTRPTYDPGPLDAGWKDEFWIALVGTLDAWLRSYYDIRNFTDDPQCVLRVGPMPAHMPVSLSDGTEIRKGELVGALHLWNEHVPRYSGSGPTLAW